MDPEWLTKPTTRRQFLVRSAVAGVGLTSMGALLAACASSSSSPTLAVGGSPVPGGVTLDFWSYHAQDQQLWEAAAKKLGGYTISTQIDASTNAMAKIIAAFQAGQAPDFVNMNSGVGTFGALAQANQILDLSDRVPDLANFTAPAIGSVGYSGKAYGIPSTQQVCQIWMNKNAAPELASLGTDGPATWADLMALGPALKAKGVALFGLMGNTAGLLQFTHAAIAATLLTDDFVSSLVKGEAKFTDPPMVDVFTHFQQLCQYAQAGAAAAAYDDVLAGIGTGKIAAFIAGSWIPADMVARNYPIPDGQFLVPGDDAATRRRAAFYYDGGWAVNAGSSHIDSVIELMKYAATAEFGQMIADIQGNIPAIAGKFPPKATEPHFVRSISLIPQVTPQSWWQFSAFDQGNPGINSLLPPACQGILTGQLTPQAAAQSVQDGLASWFTFK